MENSPPAPFIVGAGRSGTTLLRLMLDTHPELAIPPETHFIIDLVSWQRRVFDKIFLLFKEFRWKGVFNQRDFFFRILVNHERWGDFQIPADALKARIANVHPFNMGEGFRAFYRLYAERFGKARWGDKTPRYVKSMILIQRCLPEVRFIHIIRDGRDVALSVRDLWFGPNTIKEAANRWVWTIKEARRQAQNLHHYLEVRYEDLILKTEETLRQVCKFIDLPWNPLVLSYYQRSPERLIELKRDVATTGSRTIVEAGKRVGIHELTTHPPDPARIGRWKSEMKDSERKIFEEIAAPTLRELGYEI